MYFRCEKLKIILSVQNSIIWCFEYLYIVSYVADSQNHEEARNKYLCSITVVCVANYFPVTTTTLFSFCQVHNCFICAALHIHPLFDNLICNTKTVRFVSWTFSLKSYSLNEVFKGII